MHQQIIDTYYRWHEDKFGFKAKIDASDGKAVKQLIQYLSSLTPDVLPTFEYILNHWDDLEPFYQKQTRLRQINSNIHNIIYHFKNGKHTKNTTGVSEEYLKGLAKDLSE